MSLHMRAEVKSLNILMLFVIICQVALLVADNIEEHKTKLKFFMQKFCSIIKTMDSTYKELSIAIRGYGFFAAVRLSPVIAVVNANHLSNK